MKTSKNIVVSIIIPVFNGEDCIGDCLDALNNQTLERDCYEIIVVDDGSTDETAVIAEPKCDQILRTINGGPAAARNTGSELAHAPLILFTDADCIPQMDWIEKMINPFKDPQICGVKGAYLTQQREMVAQFVQAEYETKYSFMSQHMFIDFIDTYSAGFRTGIFRELGGFDLRFPGASVEDQEFSFRMSNAGYKMVFEPSARVFHRHAWTLWRYTRKKFNIGFWKVFVLKLHPTKAIRDSHTPQTLKLQIPIAALMVLFFASVIFTGALPLYFTLVLFLLTGLRESLQCVRNGYWTAALGSPGIMFCRATALGAGLVWGYISSSKTKFDLT